MGTDDQQESLSWFLAGFIEGEGALVVGIKKHPTVRFGYYVQPAFFLYQHVSGRQVLEQARAVFASGSISPKSGNPTVLAYGVTGQALPTREGRSLLQTVCSAVQLQAGDLREVQGNPGDDEPQGAPHAPRKDSRRRKGVRDESAQ